jgi:hypothetical protein
MTKIDFKKTLKHLYAPGKKDFELVEVPAMQFLMVDGHGDPNTAKSYQEAVEALYAVAYKIKFISKKELEKDYTVPPLEGLWWADDMTTFVSRAKSEWDWTMMIMTPDWISRDIFQQGMDGARESKDPAALDLVRLEEYDEGLSVQIMHLGSYDDEGPIIARLHNQYLPDNQLVENGKHHEIYLGDPRRTAPEKLKTVLRQPVCKAPSQS